MSLLGFFGLDFHEKRQKELSNEFYRSVLNSRSFWQDDQLPLRPEIDSLIARGLDFEANFKKFFEHALQFCGSRVVEELLTFRKQKGFPQLSEADSRSITSFAIEKFGYRCLNWKGEREEEAREFYRDLRKKFALLVDFGFDFRGEKVVSAARFALARAEAPLQADVQYHAGIEMVADYSNPDIAHPLHVLLMKEIQEFVLQSNSIST